MLHEISVKMNEFKRIVVMDDPSTTGEEWDGYVLSKNTSTCYHLSGWMRSIEKSYGHPCHWIVARRGNEQGTEREKRGKVCGVLPLVHIEHLLFGNSLVSLPFADLGGILADDLEVESALLQFANELRRRAGAQTIELRCNVKPASIEAMEDTGVDISLWKVLMARDLPDDPERLFQEFKPKLRSQIRKPIKEGMKFQVFDVSLLDDFYRVFSQNMRDLGSPVHAREWFRTLACEFGNHLRIGVVCRGKKPIAAGIVLACRNTLSIPWASSLRNYNDFSPNMLLYWNFLKFACENGFRRFDFGRCTPGSGTYKFKEQWGATQQPIYRLRAPSFLRSSNTGGFGVETGKREWKTEYAAKVWSRIPVPIATFFGPMVRKYISL